MQWFDDALTNLTGRYRDLSEEDAGCSVEGEENETTRLIQHPHDGEVGNVKYQDGSTSKDGSVERGKQHSLTRFTTKKARSRDGGSDLQPLIYRDDGKGNGSTERRRVRILDDGDATSPDLGTYEEGEREPGITGNTARNDSVLHPQVEINSTSTNKQRPLSKSASGDDNLLCIEVEQPHTTAGGNVTNLDSRSGDENRIRSSSIDESETTTRLRAKVIQQQRELETISTQMKVLVQQVETQQQHGTGGQGLPVGIPHDRSELSCSRMAVESRRTSYPSPVNTDEDPGVENRTIPTIRKQPVLTEMVQHYGNNNTTDIMKEMITGGKEEFREENVRAGNVEERKGVITETRGIGESAAVGQKRQQHTSDASQELVIKEAKKRRDIAMRRAKERDTQQNRVLLQQHASPPAVPSQIAGREVQGDSTRHVFIKFRATSRNNSSAPCRARACAGCWNQWEGQEQSSLGRARLYSCIKCGVVVHSGCRSYFQRVFSMCPFHGNEPDWMEVNCSGYLQVMVQQVIQLDDMDPYTDTVFAVLSLLPGKDVVQTPPASWGEMGAAWPALIDAEVLSIDDTDRKGEGVLSPLSLAHHIHNGDGTPLPVLRIEIWRKRKYGGIAMAFGSGKDMMGCAELSISPLMAHPHTPERRWLQLQLQSASNTLPPLTSESNSALSSPPLVLVTMAYVPEHLAHISVPYSSILLVPSNYIGPSAFLSPESSDKVEGFERASGGGPGPIEYERIITTSLPTPSSAVLDHPKDFNDPPVEPPAAAAAVSEICSDPPSLVVTTTQEASGAATTLVHNEEYAPSAAAHHRSLQHLFRLKSYLGPTWCVHCNGVLFGFANQGFQCEVCGVNVHRGCQVKANLIADCKGSLAINDGNYADDKPDNEISRLGGGSGGIRRQFGSNQSGSDGANFLLLESEGVGLVQVYVHSAHICTTTCGEWGHDLSNNDSNMSTEVQRNGSIGDYYCRMGFRNAVNQTQRTQTVFLSAAPVFNDSFVLPAPAYDALLELELVDSASEKVIGRWSATCFDLLQLDYDSLFSRGPLPGDILRRLELVNDTSVAYAASVVRGYLVARVSFQEDTRALFWGANPRTAPKRESSNATNDLSVELFSKAVRRTSRILKWPKEWKGTIKFVFSWENTSLSGLAAIVFIYCSLLASTEYILALPLFFFLIHMTVTLGARFSGRFERAMSTASIGGSMLPDSGEDGLFQPVAILKVAIIRGRNMLSSELGLPGNSFTRVWYCPTDVTDLAQIIGGGERNATATTTAVSLSAVDSYLSLTEMGDSCEYDSVEPEDVFYPTKGERGDMGDMNGTSKQEDKEEGSGGGCGDGGVVVRDTSKGNVNGLQSIDAENNFEIGDPPPGWIIGETTPYWLASSDPEWASTGGLGTGRGRAVTHTQNVRKGDVYLQNNPYFWHTIPGEGDDDDGHFAFIFPVLQPTSSGGHLIPWSQYHGFLRFEAFLANPFNSIMDTFIGEVRIPLSRLISKEGLSGGGGGQQPEVRGWYPLCTSTEYIRVPHGEDLTEEWTSRSDDPPELYLRMQVILRDETTPPTPDEMEASRAVFQLLNSSYNSGSGESHSGGTSKNPLTSLFKLRNSIAAVLNIVIKILDMAETLKNLLNWSHPYKSASVYCMIVTAWILLLIVPSRVFLFIGGMAAFYSGLRHKLNRDKEQRSGGGPTNGSSFQQPVKESDGKKKSPLAIKFSNLMATIPTDIELERAYLWRTRQGGSMALRSNAAALASSSGLQDNRNKIRILGLGVQWQGGVFLHEKRDWKRKFLVLQGHRLAWWTTATAVEEGKPAAGQLLLQGHSGITDPSPVEMRLADNSNLLICAFGRGPNGHPARVLFRTRSEDDRISLERAIRSAMAVKND